MYAHCVLVRLNTVFSILNKYHLGAQWLSGRVLDLSSMGYGFEPHWQHCIVSLRKAH